MVDMKPVQFPPATSRGSAGSPQMVYLLYLFRQFNAIFQSDNHSPIEFGSVVMNRPDADPHRNPLSRVLFGERCEDPTPIAIGHIIAGQLLLIVALMSGFTATFIGG